MSDGIYVALSGAIGRARQLDVVSSNLANMHTSAYRRVQPAFKEFMPPVGKSTGQAPDAVYPEGLQVQVDKVPVYLDGGKESRRPGTMIETGSPFDMALEGEGYFVLQTTSGRCYTRDGHFAKSVTGRLVSADGLPLVMTKAKQKLGAGPFSVSADGRVTQAGKEIGRLRIVKFGPQAKLERLGANRYRTPAKPIPSTAIVHQGKIETSNVRPTSELISMIEIEHSFAALQEAVRSYREMDQHAIESGRFV